MDKRLNQFIWNLQRRTVAGSFNVAVETAHILKIGISMSNGHALSMMTMIRQTGDKLIYAAPLELTIGNVVRRILHIIREEYDAFATSMLPVGGGANQFNDDTSRVFVNVLSDTLEINMIDGPTEQEIYCEPYNIKQQVLTSVQVFIDDLHQLYLNISEQSCDHIHAHETILTFGKSKTVLEFLVAAHKKGRVFSVVVAETAPSMYGVETARLLCEAGITTTLINDSAVFALMSRVNKVIIGVHAVLANGGLLSHTGCYNLCAAAHYHHVPVVVTAGLYKFTPLYSSENQDTFCDLGAPNQIASFQMDQKDTIMKNPAYEYVPPQLVTLFIANQSAHAPAYIYRLLAEYYHPDDLPELQHRHLFQPTNSTSNQ